LSHLQQERVGFFGTEAGNQELRDKDLWELGDLWRNWVPMKRQGGPGFGL
jgi:hypothetical protein